MPSLPAKKLSQTGLLTSLPVGTTVPVLLTPQAAADPAQRNKRATQDALADFLGLNRGPNLRKSAFKEVRFFDNTNPNFDPSFDVTLGDLDTLLACIGTRCFVEFERMDYVLVYDAAPRTVPGPMCWAHGHMQAPVPLVPCKWVAANSDEAARANVREWAADITDFYQEELITAPLRGRDAFFRVLAAGGPYPAPLGVVDAYYRQVAPPVPQMSTFQALTQDEAVALLDDQQVGRQRLYAITFPVAIGRPEELTVYTSGYDLGTFSSSGSLIDPANPERTIPVTVDVRSGTIINIQAQIEALASPFFSADPTDLGKLKGYATFELAVNTAGNYNFVQIQTLLEVGLTQNLTVLGLTLRGYSPQTTIVSVPTGRTLTINGSLELYNMRLQQAGGTITGLPSAMHASQLNGSFAANNASCTAIDSDLSNATITGPGTLILLGNTAYSNAQITAATAAGMTVIDKRPGADIQNSLTPLSTTKALSVDVSVATFATKASVFNSTDWINQIDAPDGSDLSGAGQGKAFVLSGGGVIIFDPANLGAAVRGRVNHFRNVGTTPTTLVYGALTSSTIGGAPSLVVQPGEWVLLRNRLGGWDIVGSGRLDNRLITANDIEITDPTKGIIMTVGGTRVRAQISGTAGARTWTFTDL